MKIETALNCLWAEVARYNPDSSVREAWHTLNTELLAQQSISSARNELCAYIDNLPLDKLSAAGWHSTVTILQEIRYRLSPIA